MRCDTWACCLCIETKCANLDRYVNLLPRAGHDAQAQQRLRVTEEMVQHATVSLKHLRQQLNRDDWIALEAEALKSFFDTDLP
jgi:hypothetical protein